MKRMGIKAAAVLLAVLFAGCTSPGFSAARQNRVSSSVLASSAASSSEKEASSEQPASSGRSLEAPGQVALYRKLGDNPPTLVETVECGNSLYQPEKSEAKLLDQWGLSKSVYVFIGWFFMDETNQPAKWTGDKDIKVSEEKETPIVAVFNIYYRKTDASRGGTLELYTAVNGKTPELANRIAGVSDYPLPVPPDNILKDKLPDAASPMRFTGWFSADETGQPIAKLQDTHVLLNKGDILRVTAVFSKTS